MFLVKYVVRIMCAKNCKIHLNFLKLFKKNRFFPDMVCYNEELRSVVWWFRFLKFEGARMIGKHFMF